MNKTIKTIFVLTLGLSLFSCKRKTEKDITTSNINTKTTKKDETTKNNTTSGDSSNKNYRKVGNNIYLGYYPQTLETNSDTISTLESKITAFNGPADATSKGWIKQIDYASNTTRESYYYRDIDLDSDGVNDYRAIHIYKYKNYNTSQPYNASSLWYHDTTKYTEGSTYYFKYKEIKWDILEEKEGKAYLYTSFALDASYFEKCSDNKTDQYSHGGKTGYANNYELSSIRNWLNNDFYNLAFTSLEKGIIKETSVNNGLSSVSDTANSFVGNNTNDKVFLLSEKELITYYPTADSRAYNSSILTDYAKIQDADYYKVLLRSPDKTDAYDIKYIEGEYHPGNIMDGSANYSLYAIRPVIVIAL